MRALLLCFTLLLCTFCLVSAQTCAPKPVHFYCTSRTCAGDDSSTICRGKGNLPTNWAVIFDSFDYANLVATSIFRGAALLSQQFDDDTSSSAQWRHTGSLCQYAMRPTCRFDVVPQDNWLFSRHVKYPISSTTIGGGFQTEVNVEVRFRFTQCETSPGCTKPYINMYRYDISNQVDNQRSRANYLPMFGAGTETTDSRFEQEGSTDTTITRKFLTTGDTGFHFAVRDEGTCGQVSRIAIYYTPCHTLQDGLVYYPELVRPPEGSEPYTGTACCVDNAHLKTLPYFRAFPPSDGRCERNVMCECDAGYALSKDGRSCSGCASDTYRSLLTKDEDGCIPCPAKSSSGPKSPACECDPGYFRSDITDVSLHCQLPPTSVTDLTVVDFTDTTIVISFKKPTITGEDFFFLVKYSDPDNTGSFLQASQEGPTVENGDYIQFTLENLQSDTPYTIKVTTHNAVSNQDRESDALRLEDVQARTKQGVPSPPQNVISVNGFIAWSRPAQPNGEITCFIIRLSGSDGQKIIEIDSSAGYYQITEDDLKGLGDSVMVEVRAKTAAGEGRPSKPQPVSPDIVTIPVPMPIVIPDPVANLILVDCTNTSFRVGWDMPETRGAGFRITLEHTHRGSFRVIDLPELFNTARGRATFEVRGLEPFTNYTVRVVTHNAATDASDASYQTTVSEVQVTTKAGVPCAPENFQIMFPENILVWDPPAISKGVITGYCIKFSGNVGELEIETDASKTYHSQPDPDILSSLGGNEFSVQVRAKTIAGAGEWTPSLPFFPVLELEIPTVGDPEPIIVECPDIFCPTEAPVECPIVTCPPTPVLECECPLCRPLSDPANGEVSVNQSPATVGSRATYSCSSGYNLENGNSLRVCGSNGEWSGSAPACTAVLCPALPNPSNGRVTSSSRRVGASVSYICNSGYELDGTGERTCQTDGSWTGSTPICREVIILCPSLTNPVNGQVSINTRRVGGSASYSCNVGYELTGATPRTCQNNGIWSGVAPTCQLRPAQCPSLTNPVNGLVRIISRAVGGVAVYSCNNGFDLTGDSPRICQPDGSWSLDEPSCQPTRPPVGFQLAGKFYEDGSTIKMSDIGEEDNALLCVTDFPTCCNAPHPRAGEFYYPDGSPVGFSFTNTLYRNRGQQMIRLNRRGDSPVPLGRYRCDIPGRGGVEQSVFITIDIGCSDLVDPANGKVDVPSKTVSSIATYTCNPGYTLNGLEKLTCQLPGQWNGVAPTCLPVQCPNLLAPVNGEVVVTRRTVGGLAVFLCNDGFRAAGEPSLTCQSNGLWSASSPTCQPIQCPILTTPANGRVIALSRNSGSIATFSCNHGYTISGNEQRTCQNGQWSGSSPTCQQVLCPPLQAPTNGRVEVPSRTVASSATYSCNSGYKISGFPTLFCLNRGVWSGSPPTCKAECPDLSPPVNGKVSVVNGRQADYSCLPGYTLIGSTRRICQSSGSWNGSAPTCATILCPSLTNPVNGQASIITRRVGGLVSYSCNVGYDLTGASTRTCQNDGSWSGAAPTCQPAAPVQCPSLTNPVNGRVTISSRAIGGSAVYSCNDDYGLIGNSQRTCQPDGSWSLDEPSCQKLSPPVGFQLAGKFYEDGSAIKMSEIGEENNALLCVTDFATCCNAPHPKAGEFYYPDGSPVGFSNTNALYRNRGQQMIRLNRRGDSTVPEGRYRCDIPGPSGALLSIYINITNDVKCSNLVDPVNGKVNVPSKTVSSIATYTCNPGYILNGLEKRTCELSGQWSGVAPTCQVPSFSLRGTNYPNRTKISLSSIGEGGDAIIFKTDNPNCCQTQRLGECSYPNGVPTTWHGHGAHDEIYRSRGEQLIILSRQRPFGGRPAVSGLYCCDIPNRAGVSERHCIDIDANN